VKSANPFNKLSCVKPQISPNSGNNEISSRLFKPEKIDTLENLLTPVKNANLMYSSLSFITVYRPLKNSLFSSATFKFSFSMLFKIGLSYSSTKITTLLLYFL